ncbi:MAG: hypothetical protein J3K34DRAFT_481948 [Monoraphidium minutum]|nr:MAG: hypothetical protein J3K34DRAFT_481948 [Monoraphidium minutum]
MGRRRLLLLMSPARRLLMLALLVCSVASAADTTLTCPAGAGGEQCKPCAKGKVSPGGPAAECTKCPERTVLPTLACDQCPPGHGGKRCRKCSRSKFSTGGSLADCMACPKGWEPAANKSICVCAPGVKNTTLCNQCLPGHGGKRCKPCDGKNKWARGGSLEDCRKCPSIAPAASADKSTCVCLTPGLEFTGLDCVPPCPGGGVRDRGTGDCDKCEANNITCPAADPCSGYNASPTGVAPACMRQLWREANCTTSPGSDASLATSWWSTQTFEVIKQDMAAYGNPEAEAWRLDMCYSSNRTLWPAGADPCSGYIASSTGIAPACMRQLYTEVGCTVPAGDDANLESRWWSTQTFEVINQDMAARAEPGTEAWRLEACYGTNRTLWPDGADTCSDYNASSTDIAPACMRQVWREANCTTSPGSDASLATSWWSTQTFEVIKQDMAAYGNPEADAWRLDGCYSSNRTLWPAGADPCSDYNASSTGIAPACMRQLWREANCTTSPGSDASLATSWWSTQTFEVIKQDMAAYGNPEADAWRLDGCYSSNRTLWPAGADPCSGYIASSVGIAPACMRQVYKQVGCTVVAGDDANLASRWWSTQTFEVINQDMAARANPKGEAWRLEACFGTNRTLWPTDADPCSGYIASSVGIAPACMRQVYKEVGCTVVAGDDANLASRWWSTQTFEVINQDMAAHANPKAEAWRLEACFGTNRTLWPTDADPCSGYIASSVGIAPACMRQVYKQVGCTVIAGDDANLASRWWSTQTFEVINQDMAARANPKGEAWRLEACFGTNRTLWPTDADPCSGYIASSVGIAPACMRQVYKEVGCTVVAGDDANLASRWWSTQTFEVINQDMAARANPKGEAWRLEACFGTNRTLWPTDADPCSGYIASSVGIAPACMRQVYKEVGCTVVAGDDANLASRWWSTQTFEVINQDMAARANPKGEAWRLEACFGTNRTLWPTDADPCSGYIASSVGIAPACMRQVYKQVGCTVVAGDDANLASRWWSTQTFEVINQDMAAHANPKAEAWRLEACYGTDRTLWPDGAGR